MKKIKNIKGQALVEFVLILPIIILILFIIIDFSNVYYKKNKLEETLDDVVLLITNKKEQQIKSILDKDITYKNVNEGKYTKVIVYEQVKLITPFSNIAIDNPYTIKSERVILSE